MAPVMTRPAIPVKYYPECFRLNGPLEGREPPHHESQSYGRGGGGGGGGGDSELRMNLTFYSDSTDQRHREAESEAAANHLLHSQRVCGAGGDFSPVFPFTSPP
ncbi:Hypothetical predicted protein [Xyrichtys novacula]|uniref:Uncharacterized protein n=1 Tax=Xyrichtys novacula TaxID=13765 RepID=A0AAV1F4Y7_XYRNO|nr:Hypothetical predicted protein [Xyrichtys novacula]